MPHGDVRSLIGHGSDNDWIGRGLIDWTCDGLVELGLLSFVSRLHTWINVFCRQCWSRRTDGLSLYLTINVGRRKSF